ncbi:hypothetical protein ACQJBY_012470 [Aegilops geniculata]
MPMPIRHSPRSDARSCTGTRTPGWTTTMLSPARSSGRRGGPRPVLIMPSAARSQLKFLHPKTNLISHGAITATPKSARAVAASDRHVRGRLLLQSFVYSADSRLTLSLQLVSATVAGSDGRGVRGEAAVLDVVVATGETELDVELPWDDGALGAPGAVLVTNHCDFPVYLKLLSLSSPAVHFVCDGWVHPVGKHPYRLFFTNDAYVKEKTPAALLKDREDELRLLRGEGVPADEPLQKWDRVYDYAVHNDLGNPDLRKDLARPVLGGSKEYPYPRRTRTSRPPTKTDPESEARAPLEQEEGIYVPCDERVGPAISAPNLPKLGGHFKSLEDIHSLFGLGRPTLLSLAIQVAATLFRILDSTRYTIKELIDGAAKPVFSIPKVISVNLEKWRTDEEFAREMLAGTNPVSIKRVTKFPLTSELERAVYGDQDSRITKEHVEKNMGNMTVPQAIQEGKLYAVDHHDWVMPYLKRINELPGAEEKGEISPRKAYAARTLLLLQDDSTLKPLAIELSSPHPENERLGAISTVYTTQAAKAGDNTFTAWELAKAHAAANDASKNNFIYHWLNAHATMEPVVIAANRQMSVLHPIHKLLKPHFRKTLETNATARQIIFGAGDRRKGGGIYRGIHEVAFFPSKYGMEMSSKAYRTWNFTELALPNELIKRGVARGDPKKPEELELLIKDYPYAVDGLEIWTAIKEWVTDYCTIYYADGDGAVAGDSELQAWWSEVRHVGHGDLSDAPWWPAMDCVGDLVETCATIIWLSSAYHAAISFGQYAYQGFVPNRPTITSREMPARAGAAVTVAEFLGSITPRTEAFALMALTMAPPVKPEEALLGERPDMERWTTDRRAAKALLEFQAELEAVAKAIAKRNADGTLKNRSGPVEVPYTLLTPTADPGSPHIAGIPNSIAV